jgi:hypothetical protein
MQMQMQTQILPQSPQAQTKRRPFPTKASSFAKEATNPTAMFHSFPYDDKM